MSEPFIAEIKIVGFNFAMRNWALCDGQLLPINQNQALFSLLGITYGGDGRTNFALPDLRGRVPVHPGAGFNLGDRDGFETHPLAVNEMPAHNHTVAVSTGDADSGSPGGRLFAHAEVETYAPASNLAPMAAAALANAGSNQGHANVQPYLTLNFQIALVGLFPPRS